MAGKENAAPSEWLVRWTDNKNFSRGRLRKFQTLCETFKSPPKTLLDIGCGLAIETGLIQKKFGAKLYLLDGAREEGSQNENTRLVSFGTADTMGFYLTESELRTE